MRVAIDVPIHPETAGGTAVFVSGLQDALAHCRTGDVFEFVVPMRCSPWLEATGSTPIVTAREPLHSRAIGGALSKVASVAFHPVTRRKLNEARWRLTTAAHYRRADVVHFPHQSAMPVPAPSIYHPHDLLHERFPEMFSPQDLRDRRRRIAFGCQVSSAVVVANRFTRDDIVAKFPGTAHKLFVIENPLAVPAHMPLTANVVREKYLIYPAFDWPHKNHARLMEALASATEQLGESIQLVLTGTDDSTGRIAAHARAAGVKSQVRMLGYLGRPEFISQLLGARALVFPSLFEGWGLPIAEAQALGVPVVASDVAGIPELVQSAALLFDPLDVQAMAGAIADVWSRDDLCHALAQAGKVSARRLSGAEIGHKFHALYRATAGELLTKSEELVLRECSS